MGRHIFAAFQSEFGHDQVIALTSSPIATGNYVLHNDYCVEGDFVIENGLDKIKTVVHAGAFTPKSGKESNLVHQCNSNIDSTTQLVYSIVPNLKKIVFLSTLDVYQTSNKALNEKSLVGPASLYGQSKYYCEKLIQLWAESNNAVHQILRIGHVYGPGEECYRKVIPATMEALLNGTSPVIYGDGQALRSFIFVSDVVDAVISAVKKSNSLGIVNVAGGDPVSISGLVQKIIEISGMRHSIEYVESSLDPTDAVFDNAYLKETLHSPVVGLDEGLSQEWAYFRELNK